jgi:DNA polymerase-3 subunit delta'
MNINAANALLKSLEEPSGDTGVAGQPPAEPFAADDRSRCVQQACPLPSEAMSLQWLAQALPECQKTSG